LYAMNDEQLNKILAESPPPTPSPALDERVMISYREITRRPLWLRAFRARIPVPVPVGVLFMAVLVATVIWRFPRPVMPPPPVAVSVPIPAPVREIATCPGPSQPVTHLQRQQPAMSAAHPRSLTNLAWTPVSRPEWRIVQ
jgi:hypothetical protein